MDSKDPTSEDDLSSFLPGDPKAFIEFLVEDYGGKIGACIGASSYDILDTAEVEDVLQETLTAVWEKVCDPGFDPDRPLRMVFAIAKNKATDAYRKKMRFRRKVVVDSDLTDRVIADMQGSDLSLAWKCAEGAQKHRLVEMLSRFVADLPPRQKAAVLALKECYMDIRAKDKYKPVAEAMSRITGKPETVAAAKSALRAGLEKVRGELIRHGIGFVEGRDQ